MAQNTAIETPAVNKPAPEGKKTLRKGSVVVTGASSGLGLATAKALAETGKWRVIMACRDFLKAERAVKSAGIAKENYTIMHLDLAFLDSVRQFINNLRRSGRPLDVLVYNDAVYLPTTKETTYTAKGFELSVGTNHIGIFSSHGYCSKTCSNIYPSKRLTIVCSIIGGLNGLNSSPMIDGGNFDGAQSYKDSKVCSFAQALCLISNGLGPAH